MNNASDRNSIVGATHINLFAPASFSILQNDTVYPHNRINKDDTLLPTICGNAFIYEQKYSPLDLAEVRPL